MFQRGGTATAMERLENLSDEVTEGRSSVRVDEDGDGDADCHAHKDNDQHGSDNGYNGDDDYDDAQIKLVSHICTYIYIYVCIYIYISGLT